MTKGWFNSILTDLRFEGVTEVYFWKHSWEKFDSHDPKTAISKAYLIYRFCAMVLFIFGYFEALCTRKMFGRYTYIYLTNQIYLTQTIYSTIYFCYLLFINYKKKREDWERDLTKIPIICKILWILISLHQIAPYVVFFGFWIVVVPNPESQIFEVWVITVCDHIQNLMVHAFNALAALVDTFMIAVPSRGIHCIVIMIYGILYGLFTYVYEKGVGKYAGNETFIYPVLNWRKNPGQAATAVALAPIAAVIGYFIFSYGIFRLRYFLRQKFVQKDDDKRRITPSELEVDQKDTNLVIAEAETPAESIVDLEQVQGTQEEPVKK